MNRFALTIDLGNAAMRAPEDVAAALRKAADWIDGVGSHEDGWHLDAGTICDANGNTVGEWTAD